MEHSNVSKLTQFIITILEGLQFKLQCQNFDFMKILAQIIIIINSKFQQNKKNLINAKMVKILWFSIMKGDIICPNDVVLNFVKVALKYDY